MSSNCACVYMKSIKKFEVYKQNSAHQFGRALGGGLGADFARKFIPRRRFCGDISCANKQKKH